MRRDSHSQVEIARLATRGPLLAFAVHANGLPFGYSGRNPYADCFLLRPACFRIDALQRNRARRAVQDLVERHHNVAFDILARPRTKCVTKSMGAAAAAKSAAGCSRSA